HSGTLPQRGEGGAGAEGARPGARLLAPSPARREGEGEVAYRRLRVTAAPFPNVGRGGWGAEGGGRGKDAGSLARPEGGGGRGCLQGRASHGGSLPQGGGGGVGGRRRGQAQGCWLLRPPGGRAKERSLTGACESQQLPPPTWGGWGGGSMNDERYVTN